MLHGQILQDIWLMKLKIHLTPIKLSAQRIESSAKEKKVTNVDFFTNCTSTIVRQVNSIENLVSEFSNFARMPREKIKACEFR